MTIAACKDVSLFSVNTGKHVQLGLFYWYVQRNVAQTNIESSIDGAKSEITDKMITFFSILYIHLYDTPF